MFLTIIYKSHRINKQISRFEAVSPLRDDFTADETAAEFPMVTPLPWESAWLQGMAEKTRGGQSLYESTHAIHACCLFREGRLLCCREDIGRHNALDKVIGWALITGTDVTRCALFTTGHQSHSGRYSPAGFKDLPHRSGNGIG